VRSAESTRTRFARIAGAGRETHGSRTERVRASGKDRVRRSPLAIGLGLFVLAIGCASCFVGALPWLLVGYERSQGIALYDPRIGADPVLAHAQTQSFPFLACAGLAAAAGVALVFAGARRPGRS